MQIKGKRVGVTTSLVSRIILGSKTPSVFAHSKLPVIVARQQNPFDNRKSADCAGHTL